MPMQVPLELAFRHVDSTEWAETEIRERVAKLEKIYDRLVSCRVKVERTNQAHGVPPIVRIELGIPGRTDLVVAADQEHLQRRFQTPDLRNAINESFRIAERQLFELKGQRSRRTKQPHHDDANQYLGQIAEMHPEDDHGFLLTKEGGLLYFHRNSLLNGDFDKLLRGTEVHYVEDIGDTGPIATKVRLKG
jgi:ribosome-associated translation inhibitor RaiA